MRKQEAYDAVYNFFAILNQKGHQVLGYTIMPNHVHVLFYFNGGKQLLNTLIAGGKRLTGYEMVKRLVKQGDTTTLHLPEQGVSKLEKQRGKKHELWQGAFDVKECRTEKFILQKLNYMHYNPCVKRWRLCKHTTDYLHSSAAFYEHGKQTNDLVKDYRTFLLLLMRQWEEEEQWQ